MIKALLYNKLVKQTSVLAGGTVIAQIIGLIATPILSRFYTPNDFGLLGSLLTIAAIISVIGSLKYEMAIVLTSNRIETKGVFTLSIWLLLLFTGLISISVLIYPTWLTYVGLEKVTVTNVVLLLLLVLGYGLQNIYYQWHSKLENYALLSKNAMAQKLGIVIFQILTFVLFSSTYGLIVGFTFGWLLALLILIIPQWKEINQLPFRLTHLKLLAKKYYRFPAYTALQNLLNSVSQGLPILMLGFYFDATTVGLYFFAVRILQLPSTIIGKSVRQVFYKRASDLKSNLPQLRKEYLKTTFGLFGIILSPVVVIFIFGPEIFQFLFGKKWIEAGEISRWLFLWIGMGFCNSPSQSVLIILKKQNIFLFYEIVLTISRFLVLFITLSNSMILVDVIKFYSITGFLLNMSLIIISYFILIKSFHEKII